MKKIEKNRKKSIELIKNLREIKVKKLGVLE